MFEKIVVLSLLRFIFSSSYIEIKDKTQTNKLEIKKKNKASTKLKRPAIFRINIDRKEKKITETNGIRIFIANWVVSFTGIVLIIRMLLFSLDK